MKKNVAIIGLGRFGLSVLKTLTNMKCEVMAIDCNKDRVSDASKFVQHCIICDSTKKENLEEIGIRNVNHVVVCIGKNVQASILTVINLKELGIEKISVRVDSEEYVKVMKSLGATEVISPEKDFGVDFAKRISLNDNNIQSYFELFNDYVLVKFKVQPNITPIKINDLAPRSKFEVLLNLIIREDKIIFPDGESMIEPNDLIYVVGKHSKVIKFEEYLTD